MHSADYSRRQASTESELSLTERRREATRLEIARAAASLIAERGATVVTAEAIAAAAGISLRTFYRYFRTKEEAITPLLASGAAEWIGLLASASEANPLDAFRRVIHEALTPRTPAAQETLEVTGAVLRVAEDSPSLRAAWLRVNDDSEAQLRILLEQMHGPNVDPLRVRVLAAAATAAIKVGLEHWAQQAGADGSFASGAAAGAPAVFAQQAFAALTGGIGR